LHRRRIEEACDQQFELFKPKMSAAITKVLMVQKTLIVKLGKVCGSLLRGFLSSHYRKESWARQATDEDVVKDFSRKPAPVNVKELGTYLNEDLGFYFRTIDNHSCRRLQLVGCESIVNLYTGLDQLVQAMEPNRTTFSEDVTVREECLQY